MQKDDKMKEKVPERREILRYIGGVSLMSIIPKTVRLRAAMMPGNEASTIGFMKRSSTSSITIPESPIRIYTAVFRKQTAVSNVNDKVPRTVLYAFTDYIAGAVGVVRSKRRSRHGVISIGWNDELSRVW